MPSLNEFSGERTDLSEDDLDWLHLLLADWPLLADLSFADLVLWLPLRDGTGFVAAGQVRPTTGPTVHHDDVVGIEVPRGKRPQIDLAYDEAHICRERDPDWSDNVPVREETIPVRRGDRVIAVIARHTNLATARTPSRLELTYLTTADDFARMIAQGRFPTPGPADPVVGSPRVGDGLIRLDDAGVVTFASPNAVSAFRRLGVTGDLAGARLGEVTVSLVGRSRPVEEDLALVLSGQMTRQVEVEAGGAIVALRVIPLDAGARPAAIVLCRDVTEVRHRERDLVSKDVTIREIHHRVKNNLQTVAALLRLQSRRLDSPAARSALEDAQRRVASIALVHESLSRTLEGSVDFDDVVDRLAAVVVEARDVGTPLVVRREGRFGSLRPETASPLSLVLVELLHNGAQHGLGQRAGTITVRAQRVPAGLVMVVADDGVGLPADLDARTGAGLGLQIVRTLVETELGGRLTLTSGSTGAVATVAVPAQATA